MDGWGFSLFWMITTAASNCKRETDWIGTEWRYDFNAIFSTPHIFSYTHRDLSIFPSISWRSAVPSLVTAERQSSFLFSYSLHRNPT